MTALLRLASPTDGDVEQLTAWLKTLDARVRAGFAALPCCVIVTPIGLPQRARLERALADLGIVVEATHVLDDWARLSTAIQVWRRDLHSVRRAVIFERLWAALYARAPAERWEISAAAHARLAAFKRTVRARLHNVHVDVGALLPKAANLHAFHLSDPGDVEQEAQRLQAALVLLRSE